VKIVREWRTVCPSCHGRGYIDNPEPVATSAGQVVCPACSGMKTVLMTECIREDITGAEIISDDNTFIKKDV
jgi:DnaJ-class molecular chaperone